MISENLVVLMGYLGDAPTVTHLPVSGDKVATLSLGVSKGWTDKVTGEKKSRTDWVRVKMFGKLALNAEKYLHKGSALYVRGSIHTDSYDKDGGKIYTTDIHASRFNLLDKNPNAGDGSFGDDPEN